MVVNSFTLPGDSFLITSRALPLSPLHCSAMGKIFLSHMEDAEIEAYFRSDLTQRTVYTITTAAVFLKEKAEILSTHVSFDRAEYEYGCLLYTSFSGMSACVQASVQCVQRAAKRQPGAGLIGLVTSPEIMD